MRPSIGVVKIPRGTAPTIDGVVNTGEWSDAAQLSIPIEPAWDVTVFLKHDDDNLYVAFQGVKHNGRRLFPEVMIDPEVHRGEHWMAGQLWLHVSENLCEGNGEYNVYEKNGVFQCAHAKAGWEANNPPRETDFIELRISFQKMALPPTSKIIGLALDVTDATGDAKQVLRYWPEGADIAGPVTWGAAVFE